MNRRDTLKLLAAASIGSAIPGCTSRDVDRATNRVALAGADALANRTPQVLTPHEYRTVEVLVDHIIPADDRSGSATDAAVPAFIDFVLEDVDGMATPFRGGLAWVDHHCKREFGKVFVELDAQQQTEVLDAIAYPGDVSAGMEPGARFFTMLRDLTASGFFSSKVGVDDLGYTGNTPQPSWDGCPPEALAHLGVSYEA